MFEIIDLKANLYSKTKFEQKITYLAIEIYLQLCKQVTFTLII